MQAQTNIWDCLLLGVCDCVALFPRTLRETLCARPDNSITYGWRMRRMRVVSISRTLITDLYALQTIFIYMEFIYEIWFGIPPKTLRGVSRSPLLISVEIINVCVELNWWCRDPPCGQSDHRLCTIPTITEQTDGALHCSRLAAFVADPESEYMRVRIVRVDDGDLYTYFPLCAWYVEYGGGGMMRVLCVLVMREGEVIDARLNICSKPHSFWKKKIYI